MIDALNADMQFDHTTLLHLFGMYHSELSYKFQGRDFRLTDVAGKVVNKLLA